MSKITRTRLAKARLWIIENKSIIKETLLKEGLTSEQFNKLLSTIFYGEVRLDFFYPRYRSKVISRFWNKRDLIEFNGKRSDINTPELIGNYIHEHLHAIGLTHDAIKWYKHNRRKVERSLVYRCGYAVRDLCRSLHHE